MKKVGELKKHIYLCNSHEERLLNELEALNVRRKINLVTKKQYKKQINGLLKGRPVEDWLNYYKEYKSGCFKAINEYNSDKNFRMFLFIFLVFLLVLPFGLNYTGFSVSNPNLVLVDKVVSSNAYMLLDGVAKPIPLQTEFIDGRYVYNIKSIEIQLNTKKLEIIDNNQVVFSKDIK